MQAKIKSTSRYPTLSFFSGVEYTKSQWREVPSGCENEARQNDYLDVREGEPETTVFVEVAPPQAIEPVVIAPITEVETVNTAENDAPTATRTAGRNRHGGK